MKTANTAVNNNAQVVENFMIPSQDEIQLRKRLRSKEVPLTKENDSQGQPSTSKGGSMPRNLSNKADKVSKGNKPVTTLSRVVTAVLVADAGNENTDQYMDTVRVDVTPSKNDFYSEGTSTDSEDSEEYSSEDGEVSSSEDDEDEQVEE